MIVIYSLGIRLYVGILYLLAPFNIKAKQMLAGRKNWRKKLSESLDKNAEYIWFHCSSLGEFEQGRPLIEATKVKFPSSKILLSFFSPSGYEIRKNYAGADVIMYLPFDSKRNAQEFIDLINPKMVFFVKYEYWHYFLSLLNKRKIPIYLVSAIFREKQVFFKWYGAWFRKILQNFTTIFVQDKESKQRLTQYGINHAEVAGDTRFDRVSDVVKLKKEIPLASKFGMDSRVLVAGSTWPADEELLCKYINESPHGYKFIIAPHEIHGSHIDTIKSLLKVPFICYSDANMDDASIANAKVLVVDTIGILSSLYQYGHVAYIGGGFGVGIHNTLEAATFAIPVIFGPNYLKFREAVQLIESKGAISISDYEALKQSLDELLSNTQGSAKTGKQAGDYVKNNTGATQYILRNL